MKEEKKKKENKKEEEKHIIDIALFSTTMKLAYQSFF